MKVAVFGAGSWGTGLASVFAANGHETVLWARNPKIAAEIRHVHTNQRYLPGASLPAALDSTDSMDAAAAGAGLVVVCVPSSSIGAVIHDIALRVPRGALIAHAVKGFDRATRQRVSEVIAREVPDAESRLCVIAGPSHAEEVVAQMPTTIVCAAYCRQTAEAVQDALMNQYMRVYTNPDVVGAELGGTLKNIIALAVGVADGLGFGDNAKAALITRGLTEISRLGVRMGASLLTFAGLSGIGDVFVTCTSRHSRNFRTGRLIGQGKRLEEALAEVGMAVEGVPTTQTTVELAREYNVEMPITEKLAGILFEHMDPAKAVRELMSRARNHEIEEIAVSDIAPAWKIDF
ncbi:NAD(P)H-dependent glycerol-3-phosphate dehydrogenase [Alicyclobacillus cycloheptanicus]|uniref:Glycerol-3-phosphate dehydrogenase [NAD(P)+] n=1 Tax=Alicyclobacillus cycloheptanicus TaxID=1457 RepID=A0ABT9XDX7_9BACL|nr:NAD(P)H-dependent glycerol-3-phosphate dehydrogenase [Alicyclobacillus cycloheptanicus]MDQ0188490.1 glycerol-3-phosphate dehydrogenase (NAD(P)+) [Alicyclobacillus cycloheptanicus]WDM01179.1 NAD(P)H-dependent glycerol-3-phosphate dehydrogenase [Alicyclobacillus cycloheptanicus]